ncbi:hypothetical protein TWF481_008568 [Arthrobotrys musiformis]|uniref:Uncharacterized protein n=1 Tax=Arthrobotrys musiformis TaxID=47236 RepID=A0AAV9W7J1_9PEZI
MVACAWLQTHILNHHDTASCRCDLAKSHRPVRNVEEPFEGFFFSFRVLCSLNFANKLSRSESANSKMTEEATKPSTTGRSTKTSNIHSILSDNSTNTFLAASPERHHHRALKIGEATLPSWSTPDLGNTVVPTKRISDQERLRLRHSGFFSAYSESAHSPEIDIQQDYLKRRKLSVVPHSYPSNTTFFSEDHRDEPLSLITEDEAPIRPCPVREYPRRLSIASVLTADSGSLPSVVSPATTTSWGAGLASSASSTTTVNPPQWPFMSELYQPVSRRSPIPNPTSASASVGSHSRKDQRAFEDTDFKTWEFDLEPPTHQRKAPLLRKDPRRGNLGTISTTDDSIMASVGNFENTSKTRKSHPLGEDEMGDMRDIQAGLSGENMHIGPQHSLEAYNDVVSDLQHKLSTKTLALEALQKEHDRLLGAYSRQQTRSAAIQKKCSVADAEIVSLSAERDRLQEAFDQSESQVQELTEQRDSINRRLVARVREYSNIIQLASQMESLSVLERKRWKERDTLLRSQIGERDKVIEDMKQRLTVSMKTDTAGESSRSPISDTDPDEITMLRKENRILKERAEELETSVGEAKQEVQRMEEIGRMLLHRNREDSDISVHLPS